MGVQRPREKKPEVEKLGEGGLEEALLGAKRQKIEKLKDLVLEAYRPG